MPWARSETETVADMRQRGYQPDRVLVKFRQGAALRFLEGSGEARALPGDPYLFLVNNPSGVSVPETIRWYENLPGVLYAEPDYFVHSLETIPSDPRWNEQWDMSKIAAPAAWESQTDAHDVVVAIIDTGIDFTHPDLQGNLWTNPSDGSHGFTCVGSVTPGGEDTMGHGTHVAGTIGAVANNGIGIAGINWKVRLLSLKFLPDGWGTISDAVLCIDQATSLKRSGVNIRVTNNSWGGLDYSQALKDAMARAEKAGILHVCAAGNFGVNADTLPMYPAAYENRGIVSVLATDEADQGAYFTNYGVASVDVAAPGVNTLSTLPTENCVLCDASGYGFLSGTSMATPHVAGVVAALFHANPLLSPRAARDVVLDFESYDLLQGVPAAESTTGGRLNFSKALRNPLLILPIRNGFPTLATRDSVIASGGSSVTLSMNASDPDGDGLKRRWRSASPSFYPYHAWVMGRRAEGWFPDSSSDSVSFTAPFLAQAVTLPYYASVADSRGGSAQQSTLVTVSRAPNPGSAPVGTLSVEPSEGPVGTQVTVTFAGTDPEGEEVMWAYLYGADGFFYGDLGFTSPSITLQFDDPSVYRIAVRGIDPELNLSPEYSAVVRIGGATGDPPEVHAIADKLSGTVPFTVNYDASGSSDSDGTVDRFFVYCAGATAYAPTGTCTFDRPGLYGIWFGVTDNDGYTSVSLMYVVADPADVDPTPTPTPMLIDRVLDLLPPLPGPLLSREP